MRGRSHTSSDEEEERDDGTQNIRVHNIKGKEPRANQAAKSKSDSSSGGSVEKPKLRGAAVKTAYSGKKKTSLARKASGSSSPYARNIGLQNLNKQP